MIRSLFYRLLWKYSRTYREEQARIAKRRILGEVSR